MIEKFFTDFLGEHVAIAFFVLVIALLCVAVMGIACYIIAKAEAHTTMEMKARRGLVVDNTTLRDDL
jgi:hypothetical protein